MNNKRIPKSDVINKIISRINDMCPYADLDKVKKMRRLSQRNY